LLEKIIEYLNSNGFKVSTDKQAKGNYVVIYKTDEDVYNMIAQEEFTIKVYNSSYAIADKIADDIVNKLAERWTFQISDGFHENNNNYHISTVSVKFWS